MIAQIHPRSSFLPLTNIVGRQRFSCTGISFRMNFKRTKSMILTSIYTKSIQLFKNHSDDEIIQNA